jgi:hypothetical protein
MTGQNTALAVLLTIIASCRTTNDNSSELDNHAANPAGQNAPTPTPTPTPVPKFKVISQDSLEPDVESLGTSEIAVCSFNISFVGHWKAVDKKSEELAKFLQPCDVIAMQELVAPPTNYGLDAAGEPHYWLDQDELLKDEAKKYPDELIESFTPWWTGKTKPQGIVEEWEADYQAFHFVGHMVKAGFDFVLSKGDTGKTVNHNNSTSSEWHVAFYRKSKVFPVPTTDMPSGWTKLDPAEPLAKHPVFDRLPYAFAFRTVLQGNSTKQIDFVLINVHLHSTQTRDNESEKDAGLIRANELFHIYKWIEKMQTIYPERDFITLGDMNVINCKQLKEMSIEFNAKMVAAGMQSQDNIVTLNEDCHQTNISKKDPKPFDQIFFDTKHTAEIGRSKAYGAHLITVDIAKKFDLEGPIFKNEVGKFVKAYSDHLPLLFVMKIIKDDD